MVSKEVKKEVLKETQKETPKKRRRLKRSVRKSMGAICLASAIAVAAIPVDGLQAASGDPKESAAKEDWGILDDNFPNPKGGNYIPLVEDGAQIYTTGDGTFQFAVVQESNAYVAVLLGYDGGQLEGNSLTIPETVNAYANISANLGTTGGFTAISRNNEFLYYPKYTWEWQDTDKKDTAGEIIKERVVTNVEYFPCYYSNIKDWFYYGDEPNKKMGEERSLEDFFYYPENSKANEIKSTGASSDSSSTGDLGDHQWMTNLQVRYIGNQTLKEGDTKNTWKVGDRITYDNKYQGLFAGIGNIVRLTVYDTLYGIGDYAFYGCTGLASITLGNGLNSIGVGAFANCGTLNTINLQVFSNIQVIGDYAFYNCVNLNSFTLPVNVTHLGDSVFENCEKLKTFDTNPPVIDPSTGKPWVDAAGNPLQTALQLNSIGAHLFKGCKSLESVSFPGQLRDNEIPISIFAGCSALKYVEVNNDTIDFKPDGTYDFEKFKNDVPTDFYFKGSENAALHTTATGAEIAYSFYSQKFGDIYERTVKDEKGNVAVYQVDENNNLVYSNIPKAMEDVVLPAAIGPKRIVGIDELAFKYNCFIKKITIPVSVTSIAKNAFMGCHSLRAVIFADGANPTIGAGAFKTQDVYHDGECTNTALPKQPELYFVGNISYSSKPFMYAMNEDEYINNTNQDRTYIIYCSGWPTNLEVQYQPGEEEDEEGTNQLIGYPTMAKLGKDNYYKKLPYMTTDLLNTAVSAVDKYQKSLEVDKTPEEVPKEEITLNDAEREVLKATWDIVLPEGIESIKTELFQESEKNELTLDLNKTITAESLKEVEEETFLNHINLVSIKLSDATVSIGDHAFSGCKKLRSVSLPATVQKMGIRPFAGCPLLNTVNFNGSPYFICDNSIIYKMDTGKKTKDILVEVLEGRTNSIVTAEETAGITEIYPEAFNDVDRIVTVDLSNSQVKSIETGTFANMDKLTRVNFPKTIRNIYAKVFENDPNLTIVMIPGEFQNIDNDAFVGVDETQLELWVEEGSMADDYGKLHNIKCVYTEPDITHTVRFYYNNEEGVRTLVEEPQTVRHGESAVEPAHPTKKGYDFDGWDTDEWQCVVEDLTVTAQFKEQSEVICRIYFYDWNGSPLYGGPQEVKKGGSAIIPQNPTRTGYIFMGWILFGVDKETAADLTNVQSDMQVMAKYRLANPNEDDGTGGSGSPDPNASGSPNPNASGSPNPNGSGSPNPNGSGSPNPNGSGSPDPNASGSPNPNASGSPGPGGSGTLYVLTVQNGSGSGSYVEGSQPVIIANDPASGMEFDYWSVSPADVKIASTVLSASIITMPAKDVTVTAHYKAKSGSSGSGTTGDGNNTQRPNGNSGSATNGGTTVVIDKNGLSNTGVVSATVNGSSDNFTIKISESATATEAALRALMAEYGDNLDNIKFFPMDISLYDSTGTTKITDTRGLSVSITLPLPDSLITYAGNNRVASVVNDRLERLSARFTTIQGVSCITFTAEHFSPYVIYVNTGDLSSGLVSDETPKTGDFIHPKWFLSIALACLSFVLFMQKDAKKEKKVKVKVKA